MSVTPEPVNLFAILMFGFFQAMVVIPWFPVYAMGFRPQHMLGTDSESIQLSKFFMAVVSTFAWYYGIKFTRRFRHWRKLRRELRTASLPLTRTAALQQETPCS